MALGYWARESVRYVPLRATRWILLRRAPSEQGGGCLTEDPKARNGESLGCGHGSLLDPRLSRESILCFPAASRASYLDNPFSVR